MAAEKDSSADVESPTEQPSFNGKLEQFSYDTAADPRPARRSPRLSKGEETTPGTDLELASPLPKRKKTGDIRSFLTGGSTTPSQSSASTSPRKRARTGPTGRKPPGYAPPEKYAHLNLLPDTLEEGLICAFVGLNPGIMTAAMGHA
jgi:thymine-DNA glycosylase